MIAALDLAGAPTDQLRSVDRELFEATVAAVFAGLPLGEVAEATRAGNPDLDPIDALDRIGGCLQTQADVDWSSLVGDIWPAS